MECAVDVDYTTLYRWVQRYAPELERLPFDRHVASSGLMLDVHRRRIGVGAGELEPNCCTLMRSSLSMPSSCMCLPFSPSAYLRR